MTAFINRVNIVAYTPMAHFNTASTNQLQLYINYLLVYLYVLLECLTILLMFYNIIKSVCIGRTHVLLSVLWHAWAGHGSTVNTVILSIRASSYGWPSRPPLSIATNTNASLILVATTINTMAWYQQLYDMVLPSIL